MQYSDIQTERPEPEPAHNSPQKPGSSGVRIGYVQHIGSRQTQQDSAGATSSGEFAVVADGMGGLADGEVVSDLVVRSLLDFAKDLGPNPDIAALLQIIQWTNLAVNTALGQDKLYQCGSTMVCSLIKNRKLLWASIGDSRIYLFRGGGLIQLNREHNLLHKQLAQAVQGDLSFRDIGPKSNLGNLTSFFGMGKLADVDFSVEPITLCRGDWTLLMSDGIYHFLSEAEILQGLYEGGDPQSACEKIMMRVKAQNHPYQDNLSLVIQSV